MITGPTFGVAARPDLIVLRPGDGAATTVVVTATAEFSGTLSRASRARRWGWRLF